LEKKLEEEEEEEEKEASSIILTIESSFNSCSFFRELFAMF
jgi:hypothetical protein